MNFASKIILATSLLLAAACSPKTFSPVLTGQIDSSYRGHRDSVYVRDSIYIDRVTTIRAKGDTVFVTNKCVEYRDRWRDRSVVDTLWRDRYIEMTVQVEKELSWWQRMWINLGKIFAGIIAVLAIGAAVKLYLKLKT